jgi:MFS transporter, DHA2 family, methylenomycin A resistance protein
MLAGNIEIIGGVLAKRRTRAESPRVMSWALVAVCSGYFMMVLSTTIVNVALPALRTELHANMSDLQWVIGSYVLMYAALLLFGGALADKLGARRIFQVGQGLFVAASMACGLAPTVQLLIIARLVQGVGAALSVPAALALLLAAYPEPDARVRAIGVWGGIAGIAATAGPILGGLLVTEASWRLVFWVNMPIGLAGMILTTWHVPAPKPQPRELDPAGELVGVLGLAALILALIEGGHGGLNLLVSGAGGVFCAAMAAFIVIERRVRAPMLPLSLFRNATFSGGNAVGLLTNLGAQGQLFVLNLYFQQVLGYSALVAGLALLPQMAVVVAGSAASGWFTARAGSPRSTMLIGLIVGSAGLLGMAVADTHTPYPLLIAPLTAVGLGMSFATSAATTAAVEGAPTEQAGLASGAINAARQIGGVIGVAALGALVGNDDFIPGLHIALIIAGATFLTGAALTMVTIPANNSKPKQGLNTAAEDGSNTVELQQRSCDHRLR